MTEKFIEESSVTDDEIAKAIEPKGYQIIGRISRMSKKTKGGIILSDKMVENDGYTSPVVKVIAVGPEAFQNTPDNYRFLDSKARCKVGDYVIVHRPSCIYLKYKDAQIIIFNDDNTRAVVNGDPTDIKWE